MKASEYTVDSELEIGMGESSWSLPDEQLLLLKREKNQLRCLVRNKDEKTSEPLDDLIVVEKNDRVFFIKKLPEKPIVLRMDHSLIISQKNSITTEILIPLTPAIALKSPKGRFHVLRDFPLSGLSKTWFGDPVSGEEAYALNITINDLEPLEIPEGSWYARCPLTIRNQSPELLSFQRLILRVPYYGLFLFKDQFYTNRITVSFRGMDQESQVKISSARDYPQDYSLYSEPQEKREFMGLKKSFYFIKSLTNL